MSKKGSKAQSQSKEQSYEVRDIVLAKVRGYPPWPGMIVNPESVPENVQNERPNAKTKKGNWYCVRFFPAGDYAWIVPKDISKLQQHEIEAYINEPYKRNGDLLQGYHIALDPVKWEEEREARRAEAAEEEANAEIDQLESDGEEEADDGEEKKSKARKRKRDTELATAKSKVKAKTKKASDELAPKKRAGSAKAKKNGVKSKTMVESEDEAGAEAEDEDAGPSKQTSPPPAKKVKREKEGEEEGDAALANDPEAQKVRDWRHKLQKAFLNSKSLPKDEDMPALNNLFTTVEQYENMTIAYLTFSKIGKVMRHIHALPSEKVPRDDEFKFRERAKTLVDKWHDFVNANKPNGTTAEGAKATTNGTSPAAKAAEAADAGATTNGKQEGGEEAAQAQAEGSKDAMEVDVEPKAETTVAAEVPAAAEGGEAEADGEPETNEDAPADAAADESAMPDVTMSEVAA
ncbi:uncharacterized protein LAESUDRAFT_338768 [Laetiporus sulphureus 93-53]|uniref:PWWP domain-containing protein n=1 Tax=Laetiporus sulphureus 93-53 TaxID=1314785 RepID=A0A165GN81_9APHY|nr:uncharacterized protein LAESUDRAFT_338768 [Laetiporus sulphureus 93-53]KZT10579.1 hypothetical protein LAESUDRAFT_338768 [Laetiporus sulphureus 93-53]